ncbi:MAG: ArsR family transcriptional regulator [Treponema sp.]|jgi:predicted transcriptional regulator|nr:ArsR family transcriptional regulator [Treponema sp.]
MIYNAGLGNMRRYYELDIPQGWDNHIIMLEKDSGLLIINSFRDIKLLRSLASDIRIRILELLQNRELNVTEIASRLAVPQSTAATAILDLENSGLIKSRSAKGIRGGQKICTARYKEILINFSPPPAPEANNTIQVEMPVGLFTASEVSAPCGLCSREGIIGYLDVPETFFSPDRIKAALVWFEQGYVEYKFPNNALYTHKNKAPERIELILEISSEVPGTNKKWLSDISVWINGVEIGLWTSPGDFGDRRGKFTPSFWKLEGSQYGILTTWSISSSGVSVNGTAVSDIRPEDLGLGDHHSVRVRIGVKGNAEHIGGVNIFGKGFGNYDQDIILRLIFD